ncbi:hypothetical protein B0H10DRAFT_2226324 [Mycena sp. CBHHK59/15]|nr:hypothetical protein B0H10DRAFT_2226324 [Mycena sp. CBHHK59/15]
MSTAKMMSVQSFTESAPPPPPVIVLLSATDLHAPLLPPLLMHEDVLTPVKGVVFAPKVAPAATSTVPLARKPTASVPPVMKSAAPLSFPKGSAKRPPTPAPTFKLL